MTTDDVLLENLGVDSLALWVESWESLLVVGDEDTTIRGTLHGTEDSVTGRGSSETDIEVGLEWPWLVLTKGLNKLELSRWLGETLVLVGEAELGESSSGDKETGGVSGGPVGQSVLDTVSLKLPRRGVGEDDISL